MNRSVCPAGCDDAASPRLAVDGCCTGIRARLASSFGARAAGLLGTGVDPQLLALEIRPCAAVHTFGMRRPIDVAFVDADGRVRRVFAELPPWRIAWERGAAAVWELPAGYALALGIRAGSRLRASSVAAASLPGAAQVRLRETGSDGGHVP